MFLVDGGGNVGIGTDSPDYNFHVTDTGDTIAAVTAGASSVAGLNLGNSTNKADGGIRYDNSADALIFRASNAEKMRIDSSGNVGIGTTPVSPLHVTSGANGNIIQANGSATAWDFILKGTNDGDADSVLYEMGMYRDDGSTNPNTVLKFGRGGGVQNGFFVIDQNGSEAMRIDADGNLLVGTTSTTADEGGIVARPDSDVSNIYIGHATGTAGGNPYIRFRYGSGNIGSITQSGTTAVLYNTSSDQRLKENIVDAPSASDDIDAIQVRSFDWKADGSHQKYGMVAQELQSVAPEAVTGDADSDDMMGVDYSKLVPMLVKEIQSLRARVAQLEGAN
jgi:hypothetical protein